MSTIAEPSPHERTWAMLAHMLTIAGHSVALGSFLPPLVIWLVKKDESEFVADQAKEALNFQITIEVALLVGWLLTLSVVFSCAGVLFLAVVYVGDLVMAIVAGIRAHAGECYRYPFAFRMVK